MGGCAVFATSPQSLDWPAGDYLGRVVEVARWSEAAGRAGRRGDDAN